ncbi:MAG: transglutaminase domain-containing protein [Candidatus Omnitrophica bacterium]|nr:transglutaminase domain-containing protein [Candidatus Omnitrophota bacterium]
MKNTLPLLAAIMAIFNLTPIHSPAQSQVDWMGAYLNGNKVGWSLLAVGPEGRTPSPLRAALDNPANSHPPLAKGPFYLLSKSSLEIQAYGSPNELSWEMLASLNLDFTLRGFRFEMIGKDSRIALAGRSESGRLAMTILSASSESIQEVDCPSGPLFVAEALPIYLAERLSKGEEIDGDYAIFEPHQLSCAVWKVTLDGRETFPSESGPVETYRINQDVGGLTSTLWIDESGRVLKEWAPLAEGLGYVSYTETADQARDLSFIHPMVSSATDSELSAVPTPDLLYATCVRIPERIRNSDQVDRMVIDLWGFQLEDPIPEGRWQTDLGRYRDSAPTEEFPMRLEIRSPNNAPLKEAVNYKPEDIPESFSRYLREESLIQSDHPRIRTLAKELTADAESPWEKALAIYDWIESNIRTEFRITLPSALEVLDSKKGDCNEQSTLFAALGRAAGIPTRICTGLVYQTDGFYYHAWNEVLISVDPEIWAPIDPALKQTRVDATHIKFGEGGLSDQAYLNQLIGRIHARIVEFDKHDPNREPDQTLRNQNSG